MKVIKQGQEHKPRWIGCWVCPTCGSHIVLEEGDKVQSHDDQRDGYMIEFPCPVCGNCPGLLGGRETMPCTYISKQCP